MSEEETLNFTIREFQDLLDRVVRLGIMEGFSKGLNMWPHMYASATGWIDTGDGKKIQTEEGKIAQKYILDVLDKIKEGKEEETEDNGHH